MSQNSTNYLHELVVYGYIHSVERLLTHQIIPISINMICYDYYYSKNVLFHLEIPKNNIRIVDLVSENYWKCKIKPLKSSQYKIHSLSKRKSHLCYVDNIKLPPNIISLYSKQTSLNNSYNEYDAIFDCRITKPTALIIGTNQLLGSNKKDIDIYQWELPSSNMLIADAMIWSSLYSNKYGLIVILANHEIYNLELNKNDWKYLGRWNSRMWSCSINPHIPISSVMINYNINDERCFVVCNKITEIGNFSNNQWIKLKSSNINRINNSIYYNKSKEYVYIGGGLHADASNNVQYFSLNKNKYYNLPKTQMNYNNGSSIWIEKNNQNTIYIGESTNKNCIEYIDLRSYNRKWHFKYGEMQYKTLKQLFGYSKKHVQDKSKKRLLQSFLLK